MALYDTIGRGYRALRRPDPRIAARITEALGPAESVVNVGAGAGSYEPRDRRVLAVEPSMTMIRQRDAGAPAAVCASAVDLPLAAGVVDAALAILTIQHWPDQARGLRELRRVARRRAVILTWDPTAPGFWLTTDYFPRILAIDRRIFPPLGELRRHLGSLEERALPIPHDCSDGFLGAYWRRPEAYLDPRIRSAISTCSRLEPDELTAGLDRLREDLASGAWRRRHAELLEEEALDLGYRLVVAGG
jgi:SAM-dependent methyltransferase